MLRTANGHWVARICRVLFGVIGLAVAPISTAIAGENYALLVAVGDYDPKQLNKLPYTRNDVIELRDVLLKSGFKAENVTLMHDDPKGSLPARLFPESAKIRKQLSLILSGRDEDDSVIIAFAGHGIQFKGDESSYFCPLDVDLEKKETLLPFQEIYDAMKVCGAKRKLLLVDACRNDPRTSLARSRATVDLESITRPQKLPVPETVLAYFSCAPGQQSFEWPDLKHGVFFHHVLEAWKNGIEEREELTLDDVVSHSRKKTEAFVRNNLEATQTPELLGKSAGKWVLRELQPPPLLDAKNGKTAAEARASQELWAKHLKRGVEIRNSLGMTLRLIPPGEYLRGSTQEEIISSLNLDATSKLDPNYKKDDGDDELPRHTVRLTRPFYLASTEVTLGQFRRFVTATGYLTEAEKGDGAWAWNEKTGNHDNRQPGYSWKKTGFPQADDHPVVNVSWNDANAFISWLSREEGREYRLPTEAEWEFACRAGTTTLYQSGNTFAGLEQVANVADATSKAKFTRYHNWSYLAASDGHVFTAPVAKYRANGFGLFDMHCNAIEWCSDAYDAKEYARYADQVAENPTGPPAEGRPRVLRGGCWLNMPWYCRTARRTANYPDDRSNVLGFRVAADPSGK